MILFFSLNCLGSKIVVSGPISELEFADRDDLEEVFFAEGCGVTEIPDYAFLGCVSLRSVTLPSGLKKIGFQAFSECEALGHINLPASLEDIGSNAFAYCASLENVSFPDSLKHIGHNAFSFCGSLTEVFLPDGVREIESYAFSDCAALRVARLPANGNLLGELIFNCCGSLTELVEPSPLVPKFDCDSFIFDPIDTAAYSRCVLKVPASAIESYRSSPAWSLFGNINCY